MYLNVLPATAIASMYAFKTGGKDKFHIGLTKTYLSASKNSSRIAPRRVTFLLSSEVSSSPLAALPQPVNTSLSI